MDWSITFEEKLMVISLSGVIDVDSIMQFARDGQRIEQRLPQAPDRLTDLSDVTDIHLDKRGLNELARHRKSLKFPNPYKSAIIAPQLMHYGYAKMFQTLNDHPQVEIRVFQKTTEARAWLKPARNTKSGLRQAVHTR